MSDTDEVTPRAEVLREAEKLITGDRNVTYGTPTQNFTNIAELLTTRFRHKLKDGESISATDAADIQILVKIARNISQTKRDNFVDIAGYAACGYETTVPEPESQSPNLSGITISLGTTEAITYNNTAGSTDPFETARRVQAEIDSRYGQTGITGS